MGRERYSQLGEQARCTDPLTTSLAHAVSLFVLYVRLTHFGPNSCRGPFSFQVGEECLDPVHRQLLQHYASPIHSQRKTGRGDPIESTENRAHGSKEGCVVEDSCSRVDGSMGGAMKMGAAEPGAAVDAAVNGERTRDTQIETTAEKEVELEAEEAAANHSWFSSPPGSEQGGEREGIQIPAVASSKGSSSGDTCSAGGSGEESEDDEEDDDNTTGTSATSSSGGASSTSDSDSDEKGSEDSEDTGADDDEDGEDDADIEERPQFEPIVDGVTISSLVAGSGNNDGDGAVDGGGGLEVEARAGLAAPTDAAAALLVHEPKGESHTATGRKGSAAVEDPAEIRNLILGSSSSISTASSDYHDRNDSCSTSTGQDRQEKRHQGVHRGMPPLPRPVLAGPAATEVAATLGDERGMGFCAATARKNLVAARKARQDGRQGTGQTICHGGAGTTSSSAMTSTTASSTAAETIDARGAALGATRGQQALNTEVLSIASATSNQKPAESPPRRGNSPPRGGPTTTATASARGNQAPQRSCIDDDTPPSLPPLALGELLSTLAEVDAGGGGGGTENGARDGAGSRSPTIKPYFGFGGGSASGTAGARRQGRIRAMEDAKRIASDMTLEVHGRGGERREQRAVGASGAGSANPSSSSRVAEIIAVVLRLTGDADFKIVRRNFPYETASLQ